jgi:hypothetical protein
MDTEADLAAMLADFGVPVTGPSSMSGLGILDEPERVVVDGQLISADYVLIVKTAEFGLLKYGDEVTVDGDDFKVREPLKYDDGKLLKVMLSKSVSP